MDLWVQLQEWAKVTFWRKRDHVAASTGTQEAGLPVVLNSLGKIGASLYAAMAQATVKGRAVGAGTGDQTDLTATQLNEIVGSAELQFIPVLLGSGSAGITANPVTNVAGGTQYGIRIIGNPANATNFIGIGMHGSPNFTNFKASLWIGNEAGRPGMNIGYAQTIDAPVHGAMIAGRLGLGVSSPQNKYHAHDGNGGWTHGSKTLVNATPQIIIPNGAGDVTSVISGSMLILCAGSVTETVINQLPGTSQTSAAVGGCTFTMATAANGEVTVFRASGASTATIIYRLYWI